MTLKTKHSIDSFIFKEIGKSQDSIDIWNARSMNLIKNIEYYVYEHFLDGVSFYIGKGSGKRCFDFKDRNENWINHVNGRESEIIVSIDKVFQFEHEAFDYEKERILLHESKTLTNMQYNKGLEYESNLSNIFVKLDNNLSNLNNHNKEITNKVRVGLNFDVRKLKSLKIVSLDLLISFLSKVKENEDEIEVSMKEIRKLTGRKSLQAVRILNHLKELNSYGLLMYNVINRSSIKIKVEGKLKDSFVFDNKGYFFLNEFTNLSIYSKFLYLELSKHRGKKLEINKEDLLSLFPENNCYNENYFIKRVLVVAVEEVEKYMPGLKIEGVNYRKTRMQENIVFHIPK